MIGFSSVNQLPKTCSTFEISASCLGTYSLATLNRSISTSLFPFLNVISADLQLSNNFLFVDKLAQRRASRTKVFYSWTVGLESGDYFLFG